ncbi:MAG: hypothetical protein EXR69_02375 [Myxococcales bacterium]|nr:hypothetical protein [Myxococcales bacterium]
MTYSRARWGALARLGSALGIGGVSGCGTETERLGFAPWPDAPVVADVPSDVPQAESRAFDMNFGGGVAGAPYGVGFFVPPGVVASPVAGRLSDGSMGFSFTVPTPGDAVVCTAPVRMQGRVSLSGRMRVAELVTTAELWTGFDVELRARDEQKRLVSPEGTKFVRVAHVREQGGFEEWSAEIEVPTAAVQAEVCWRFLGATGTVEVDRVVVESPGMPVPVAAPIVSVEWPMDEPGGPGGAPLGFSFLIPPGTTGAALSLNEGEGLRIAVDNPGNALACSDAFSVAPGIVVSGRVKVDRVQSDDHPWTGFVAEVRSYDMVGRLASSGTTPFTLLRAWKLPTTGWEDFTAPFAPPKGAVSGKVCFRFVEATGVADVDGAGVGE